jgi:predicted AAA+ superfamily ATPase
MIPRHAEATARRLAGFYPIVAITGPRQAGKTTLAKAVFPSKPYASLEDPDVRDYALSDPRGFLAQYPDGAVLDEAQRCPALFSYLQTRVDEDRRMGLFVLTGSQQFGLLAGISQSLAGHVGLVHLLPLSLGELAEAGRAPDLDTLLWQGLYPSIYDRNIPPHVWYADYLATYVERDVRQMINVRDLNAFRRFVRMCAARTAQPVNLSALAADCGITHNTAKAWISILEASYLVMLLPPHHRNFGKRLSKTPKLYFYDPGLAAWLAGAGSPKQLALGALRGPLFETWVVSEFVKYRCNRALAPQLYYWRDNSGHEIDLLVERGERLMPVEIKSGQTVAGDWFDTLRKFAGWSATPGGCLVYGGNRGHERHDVKVFGWKDVAAAAEMALTGGGG